MGFRFYLVDNECLKNASTHQAPIELSFITATFSSVLMLVTIPTNLLVCLAILIDPNKDLKTQFNCFTFNLALADLVVGCITHPIAISSHIKEGVDTENGAKNELVIMNVLHISYFISAMASVLSIAALALERYLAVTKPFIYREHFSVKMAVVLSIIIWIFSTGFGFLSIFVEYIVESFIFVNTALFFTGIVVCFTYCRIRSTLRQVSKVWEETGIRPTTENDAQMKLTKTFALIIGALLCSYVPACTVIYFMNLCQQCDCDLIQWFRDAAAWLVLLNSAINPFVYAGRSSSFRNAIRMIVQCKCRQGRRTQERQMPVHYAMNNKREDSSGFGSVDPSTVS